MHNPTDFNDLHKLAGLDAVRLQIESATPVMNMAQPEATGAVNAPEGIAEYGPEPDYSVELIQASGIQPERITWLWKNWLARGKFEVLAGQAGTGKTTAAVHLGATITRGGVLPDGTRAEVGSVAMWSGEDGIDDTLVPRFMAAGADMSKVFFVTGRAGKPFDPSRDMAGLASQLKNVPDLALVIIDPVVSVVSGDSHKNAETRRSLQPLVDAAHDTGACWLGITHFSKSNDSNRDPLGLVTGSLAFGAVARLVLGSAKVKNPDECGYSRILCRLKSNIGPDEDGIAYDLQMVDLPGFDDFQVSTVKWGEYITGHSRDLLTPPTQAEDRPTRANEAADFIKDLLSDGSMPQKIIEERAKQAGISYATLKRAKQSIGVISRKVVSGWFWELPDNQGDHARGSNSPPENHEPLDPLDPLKCDDGSQEDQEAQGDHEILTGNLIPLAEPLVSGLPDFDF